MNKICRVPISSGIPSAIASARKSRRKVGKLNKLIDLRALWSSPDDSNTKVWALLVSFASLFCVDTNGNGDGTADLLWAVRMENKTEESVPAIYIY